MNFVSGIVVGLMIGTSIGAVLVACLASGKIARIKERESHRDGGSQSLDHQRA